MMHTTMRLFSLALLVCVCAAAAAGLLQARPDWLEKGVEAYRAGRYTEAGKILQGKYKPGNKGAEEAAVLLIDIYLRTGRLDKAQESIQQFRRAHYQSQYFSRALYYQGLLYLSRGKHYDAARMLTLSANRCRSPLLYASVKKRLLQLAESGSLGIVELQNIVRKLQADEELLSTYYFALGELQSTQGRHKAAASTYEQYLGMFPKGSRAAQARQLRKQAMRKKASYKTVLIMAPVTGIYADIGRALTEGFLSAFEERGGLESMGLQYRIIDTQGEPLAAVRRLRQAMAEDAIIAVLGPAMSDVAITAAVELSRTPTSIPMVTPTATTHGIADLGEAIFQTNVTTWALGRAAAEYSLECRNMREFAIVAPNSDYGVGLAEAFEATVRAQGGRVVATEYYEPEAEDHGAHFQIIRRRKARSDLETLWREKGLDPHSIPKRVVEDWVADSVLALDGIFIPAGNGEEANIVASQARFNKLRAQILGSSGWYDRGLLHKTDRGALGTIFSMDAHPEPDSPAWKKYRESFEARWGHQPNKVSNLGYDGALFLLEGLSRSGGGNPERQLREIGRLKGIQGELVMNSRGYNQATKMIRISKKSFEVLEACGDKEGGKN